MQQTQNYKLNKPDYSDGADIAVLNENMDVLDGELIKKIQSDKPVNMTAPITAGGAQDLIVKQVRNTVISSGTPSGGLHGDVWLKYEPSASDDRTWKKYDCATVPCVTCTGTGGEDATCTICSGTGNSIGKGTFVADITAAANSYPSNGRHTDGFWYVIVPIA